jgi:hypothetical protein
MGPLGYYALGGRVKAGFESYLRGVLGNPRVGVEPIRFAGYIAPPIVRGATIDAGRFEDLLSRIAADKPLRGRSFAETMHAIRAARLPDDLRDEALSYHIRAGLSPREAVRAVDNAVVYDIAPHSINSRLFDGQVGAAALSAPAGKSLLTPGAYLQTVDDLTTGGLEILAPVGGQRGLNVIRSGDRDLHRGTQESLYGVGALGFEASPQGGLSLFSVARRQPGTTREVPYNADLLRWRAYMQRALSEGTGE